MNGVAVLVAGMHRSGTSAVTRMLVGLGCDAPRTCMEADAHNALGYWESTVIMELNDAILASGGSSWDDWGPFSPSWCASPAAAPFRKRALDALELEFGDSPLFVLKDPRVCRLLTFWKECLKEFGTTPRVVLPVRNPLEVAASLAQRDLIEEPSGALLWLRNVLDAEASCRDDPRAFIRYDEVLANWEAAAERLAQQLSVVWPKCSATTALDIDENLRRGLKHQVRTDADVNDTPGVAEWVKSTYAILVRWARDDAREGDEARLDATRAALDEAEAVFRRPLVLGVRAKQREVRLDAELSERHREVEALAAQVAAKDSKLATLGETLTEKDVRIDALEHAVRGLDGQIAAKDSQLSNLGEALAEKDVRIDALEHAVRGLDGQIAAKDSQLSNLGEALAEKDVRIDALEHTVLDRDRRLADGEAQIAAKDGQLSDLGEALTAKDVRIDALEHTVKARDDQLREFAEAQAQADAQTRRLALEVEAFRTSTFWRITWPMRAVKHGAVTTARWCARVLGVVMLTRLRLAWRLLPLGKARKERIKGMVGRRTPKALAVRNALIHARADGYVSTGRLDLADYNHRAGQGKGGVPILFDPDWYLANNPDVQLAGVDPLQHYLENGIVEGRLPMAIEPDDIDPLVERLHRLNLEQPAAFEFDAAFYQALHPDLAALDEGALAEHYQAHGRVESRVGSKGEFVKEICHHPAEIPLDFHADEYIDLYPDLIAFKEQPALAALRHYMLHGRWEPRLHTLRGDAAPPAQMDAKQPPPAGRRSLCVLIHAYYPELWPELAGYIQNLPQGAYDLYVNLVDATFSQESLANIRDAFPTARVYISENLGRDIGGQFQLLKNLRMEDYDIFCLLHTKRSPHMAPGEVQRWRRRLLVPLLGSPECALENLELMRADGAIGQLGAAACRYTELNDNPDKYFDALRRLGIDENDTSVEFLSGTMMFVRGDVLGRVFEALCDVPFETGDGASLAFHQDGQWAHAVERAIGAAVRDMGYRFEWR